ncbi:hypothetical protein HPB51_027714 [Rhipicephalus microplus]|uniref:Uncharacterized protein n=1 Tax=Rhipicephalus microplus TaxID=6941 RepID=A0A9J6CZ77_RHIMP|nr:hypothetical protein HPB51_027714 [Rhipicephalus microplus]
MTSPMMGGYSSHVHRHHHCDHIRHGVIAPSPTLPMVTLPTALPSGHTPPLPPIRPTRIVTGWEASGVLEATPTFGPGIVEPTSRPPESSLSPPLQPTVTRKPGNSRPMLNKRLQKLVVTAGKVWSYQILKDAFHDAEDGVCQPPAFSAPSLENQAPTRRNPIGLINAAVGDILLFIIPDDTFYDYEDGSTRYLALSFLSADGVQLPQTSWIQFNPRTQELYGLPFDVDIPRQ